MSDSSLTVVNLKLRVYLVGGSLRTLLPLSLRPEECSGTTTPPTTTSLA